MSIFYNKSIENATGKIILKPTVPFLMQEKSLGCLKQVNKASEPAYRSRFAYAKETSVDYHFLLCKIQSNIHSLLVEKENNIEIVKSRRHCLLVLGLYL